MVSLGGRGMWLSSLTRGGVVDGDIGFPGSERVVSVAVLIARACVVCGLSGLSERRPAARDAIVRR